MIQLLAPKRGTPEGRFVGKRVSTLGPSQVSHQHRTHSRCPPHKSLQRDEFTSGKRGSQGTNTVFVPVSPSRILADVSHHWRFSARSFRRNAAQRAAATRATVPMR